MSPSEIRHQLRTVSQEIFDIDIEELVREKTLGTSGGFGKLRRDFEIIQSICGQLSKSDLASVPDLLITELNGLFSKIGATLQQVRTFTGDPTEKQVHDALLQEVPTRASQLFKAAVPLTVSRAALETTITWVRREVEQARSESRESTKEAIGKLQGESGEALSRAQVLVAEKADELNALQQETQKTLETAQEAAKTAGFTAEAKHFKTTGGTHQESAKDWLKVVVASAAVLLIYASGLLIYTWQHPAANTAISGADLQLGLAKVLVFSVLLSLVVGTTRIYRAHRHNQVVNKHRENALKTFQTFIDGAADVDTKNAILLFSCGHRLH